MGNDGQTYIAGYAQKDFYRNFVSSLIAAIGCDTQSVFII